MWKYALMLGILACGGEEEAAPPPPVAKPIAPTPPPAAEEEAEEEAVEAVEEEEEVEEVEPEEPEAAGASDKAERGKQLARAGHSAAAVAMIEPLLGEVSDADVWDALARAAIASGGAEALMVRLAEKPESAPDDQYNLLRARLALAAGDGKAAMEAATAYAASKPEIGAALMARAARAGGAAPADLDMEKPSDALIIAATNPGRAAAALKKADVKGWEALALRAELKAGLKDDEGAAADWAAAMSVGGDAAAAALGPALAAEAESAEAASDLYKKAAAGALKVNDGAAAGAAAAGIVDTWLKALDPDKALQVTSELDEDQTYTKYDYAPVRVQIARAAMAAGEPARALEVARSASKGFHEQDNPEAASVAAFYHAHAAMLLANAREASAAAGWGGSQSDAVDGVYDLMAGRPMRAYQKLKDNGFEGAVGASADLLAADAAASVDQDPMPLVDRAVSRADASGYLPARIEARLERQRHAAARGDARSADALLDLGTIADELGELGVPLTAEIAARTIMSGGTAKMPKAVGEDADAWTALNGAAAPDSAHPIVLWAKARNEAMAQKPERLLSTYSTATENASVHRRGPWMPISVLDGSAGPGIDVDLKRLKALPADISGLAALRLHEWYHATRAMDAAFIAGDSPSLSLPRADRDALNGAYQKLRAGTLLWLAGGGDRPTEASEALDKLDTAAMEVKGFARSIPSHNADLANLRERLQSQAIISIRLAAGGGEVVVLTSERVSVQDLPDHKGVISAANQMRDALIASANQGYTPVSPAYGDAVRQQLLDPIAEDLRGIGRYLIIPDGILWGFSLGALPEQALGKRFMADIRSITTGITVSSTFRSIAAPPSSYSPDYLGMSPKVTTEEEKSLKMPSEVENSGRLFGGGLKEVRNGEEATAAIFKEMAPTARFLHLSNVPTGDNGDLVFADKPVSLARLRDMDLMCQIAVISAEVPPATALRRVQALEAAGANSVLFSGWLVEESARGKLMFSFYDSQNRDMPPAISMTEARKSLRESDDKDYFQPSWWAQYVLSGQP